MIDVEKRFQKAAQYFWTDRQNQQKRQLKVGKPDAGQRGSVTGGAQMGAFEMLVSDILIDAGIDKKQIKTRTSLELPGYYRPEKKWDLVVVSEETLVAAIEFKSQVGPSFGNNFNNRSEEAIGSAADIWVAFREGRFSTATAPFVGYFFVLEDCPRVWAPVRNREPYFQVDPVFAGESNENNVQVGVSYVSRYQILCKRLITERLYSACCLTLATNAKPTSVSHPADDLSFKRFTAALQGHVVTFLGARR